MLHTKVCNNLNLTKRKFGKVRQFIVTFPMVAQMVPNSVFLLYVFSLILFIFSHLFCVQFLILFVFSKFICIQSHLIYIQSGYIYSVPSYLYSVSSYLYSVNLYIFSFILYVFSLILFIFSQLICIQSHIIFTQSTFIFCKHVLCVTLRNLIKICSFLIKSECMSYRTIFHKEINQTKILSKRKIFILLVMI